MKKTVFLLIFLLFLLFGSQCFRSPEQKMPYETLSDLSLKAWKKWMENPASRKVFDLEEAEAKEVFGFEGEEIFL